MQNDHGIWTKQKSNKRCLVRITKDSLGCNFLPVDPVGRLISVGVWMHGSDPVGPALVRGQLANG